MQEKEHKWIMADNWAPLCIIENNHKEKKIKKILQETSINCMVDIKLRINVFPYIGRQRNETGHFFEEASIPEPV